MPIYCYTLFNTKRSKENEVEKKKERKLEKELFVGGGWGHRGRATGVAYKHITLPGFQQQLVFPSL